MANLPSRKALPTYILSFTALILPTSDRRAEIGFCRLVYFPKTILTLGIPILNISLIGEKRYLIFFFFFFFLKKEIRDMQKHFKGERLKIL